MNLGAISSKHQKKCEDCAPHVTFVDDSVDNACDREHAADDGTQLREKVQEGLCDLADYNFDGRYVVKKKTPGRPRDVMPSRRRTCSVTLNWFVSIRPAADSKVVGTTLRKY